MRDIVGQVPDLDSVLTEHTRDNDGIIPHLLMADITRFLIRQYEQGGAAATEGQLNVKAVLAALERGLALSDLAIRDLVYGSFLENLEPDDPAARWLATMFGPRLREAYRSSRR